MSARPGGTVERRPSRLAAVVAGALAVVVALALVGGGGGGDRDGGDRDGGDVRPEPPPTSSTPTTAPPRPLLPGEPADLVVAGDGRLARIDLGSGALVDLPLGDPAGGIVQPPVVVGDDIVVVQRFVAWSIDPAGARPPRQLGPADAVVTAGERSVWLVDQRRDRATRVAIDDGDAAPATATIPLPDGTWRVSAVTGRFVLSSQTRWLLLDADGRVVRDQPGRVLASGRDVVVWLERPCGPGPCEIRVSRLDVDTPDRTFTLTATPSVSIHEARIVGDGTELLLGGDLEGDRGAYEVVRVDLTTTDPPEVVAGGLVSAPLTFAAGERTRFWTTRVFGGSGTELTAYEPETGLIRTVDLPVHDVSTFSAL